MIMLSASRSSTRSILPVTIAILVSRGFRLLVVFAATKIHKRVDELLVPDIDTDLLRAFLWHIEEKRKCSISSRNQRLAAIHALSGFIAERCPEYLDWCARLRAVKSKRPAPTPVCYLEKPEIDALLDAPSSITKLGYRDRALLLFLYNSGARAEEAAKLCIEDLSLHCGADGALSSVRLHGKGGKVRICPLWASTTYRRGLECSPRFTPRTEAWDPL